LTKRNGRTGCKLGPRPALTRAECDYLRDSMRRRYPDKPWRANFPEVDWDYADTLDAEVGLRALALASDTESYVALMRGESVPVERLNAEWVRRFGLKGAV
jgi:hypothetical protein